MKTPRKLLLAIAACMLVSASGMAQERRPFEGIIRVQGFINANIGKKTNAKFEGLLFPDGIVTRYYTKTKFHEIDSVRRIHTIHDLDKHVNIKYFELINKGFSLPLSNQEVKGNMMVKISLEPTGEKETILGHPCEKWKRIIQLNKAVKAVAAVEGIKSKDPVQDLWVSSEYEPFSGDGIVLYGKLPGLLLRSQTSSSTTSTFTSGNMFGDEIVLSIEEKPLSDDLFTVPADCKIKACKGASAFSLGLFKANEENMKAMKKLGIKVEEQKTNFITNEDFDE